MTIKPLFGKNPSDQKIHTFIAFMILLAMLFAASKHFFHHHQPPAQSVVVAKAVSRNVPVYLPAIGTVTPINNVKIQTQINGELIQVLFTEGQMVKAGDVLAVVDPRPYQAQVAQYSSQLARDRAFLANTRLDLKRYQTLWKQDSVAKQTLDTQISLVQQYEATVAQDAALLANAKLNLSYCYIKAPVAGRIGLRGVDPGNYIQISSTTPIAVINILNPITVLFSLPEDDISRVRKQLQTHKTLPALVYDREKEKLLARGSMYAMDSQVDPTTGTVRFRASFNNADEVLFPSQFVNVNLLLETLSHATVVPTAAIQYGASGAYVYLVNQNATVSVKPVTVKVAINDETAITGITPGQSVVVEGADKLTEGARVDVTQKEV